MVDKPPSRESFVEVEYLETLTTAEHHNTWITHLLQIHQIKTKLKNDMFDDQASLSIQC